jgi:hypothetical protein
MGLRGEMQNWFDIVELSKGFRDSGQNLGEQGRAQKLRELAARAPEMLAQPGGAQAFAAESGALGDPAMLRQLAAQKAGYEAEMGQGLSPEQLVAMDLSPEEIAPFKDTSLEKQKLILGQKAKREEMDFEKDLFYAKQAAKKVSDDIEEGKLTDAQGKASGFYVRAKTGHDGLNEFVQKNPDFFTRFNRDQIIKAFNSPSSIQSEELQRFINSFRSFITPQLRDETGATIQPDEYIKAEQEFIPQAGNPADLIERKSSARTNYIASLKTRAGSKAIARTEKYAKELKEEDKKKLMTSRQNALKERIAMIPDPRIKKAAEENLKRLSEAGDIPDGFISYVNKLIAE